MPYLYSSKRATSIIRASIIICRESVSLKWRINREAIKITLGLSLIYRLPDNLLRVIFPFLDIKGLNIVSIIS